MMMARYIITASKVEPRLYLPGYLVIGDFDEPIEDLRKNYLEGSDETAKKSVEQKIEAQCFAFADFLGMQEEMQSMINISDLSIGIKQTLLAG